MTVSEVFNRQLKRIFQEAPSLENFEKYVMSELLSPIEDYPNYIRLIRDNYSRFVSISLLIIGAELIQGWTDDDNEMLAILNNMYQFLPQKEKAIVCYLNATELITRGSRYPGDAEEQEKEIKKDLLKSMEYNVPFANNRIQLARISDPNTAQQLYREAAENIQETVTLHMIQKMSIEEFIDPDRYISEFILGTTTSEDMYKDLLIKAQS